MWTTIDKSLKDELKVLPQQLGFKSETDCVREAIRLGTENLRAQRSLSFGFTKRRDSILSSAGLLSKEYERMKPRELEMKTRPSGDDSSRYLPRMYTKEEAKALQKFVGRVFKPIVENIRLS